MRYHYTAIKMAKSKKIDHIQRKETSSHRLQVECKMAEPLQKTAQQFLKKQFHTTPTELIIFLLFIQDKGSQKDKKQISYVSVYLCGIQKNGRNDLICKTEIETWMQRKSVWAPRWGDWGGMNWEIGIDIYICVCVSVCIYILHYIYTYC